MLSFGVVKDPFPPGEAKDKVLELGLVLVLKHAKEDTHGFFIEANQNDTRPNILKENQKSILKMLFLCPKESLKNFFLKEISF